MQSSRDNELLSKFIVRSRSLYQRTSCPFPLTSLPSVGGACSPSPWWSIVTSERSPPPGWGSSSFHHDIEREYILDRANSPCKKLRTRTTLLWSTRGSSPAVHGITSREVDTIIVLRSPWNSFRNIAPSSVVPVYSWDFRQILVSLEVAVN